MNKIPNFDIGLEYVLDLIECSSPFGENLKRNLKPYADEFCSELVTEYENISAAIRGINEIPESFDEIKHRLMPFKDIRRSVAMSEGVLDEIALFEIKRFVLLTERLSSAFEDIDDECGFYDINIHAFPKLVELLNPDSVVTESFSVSSAYTVELAKIRDEKRAIERKLRECTDDSERADLKNKRTEIVEAEFDEEYRIRERISKEIYEYKDELLKVMDAIGRLDFIIAKAELAIKYDLCRPKLVSDGRLSFKGMVHPMIKAAVEKNGLKYTPVNISISRGATVITGANMGGKSVSMKAVALNTTLALCGIFAFAKTARVPMFDNIFMLAEDSEDALNGLSSFGGEVARLRASLEEATDKSLLLFDEFARGTNPEEGGIIMRGLVRFMNGKRSVSIFATHYDGVAELASKHYRVIGLRDFSYNKDIKNSADGIKIIAGAMNYGLYEVKDKNASCPREASSILKLLLKGTDVLDSLLSEYEHTDDGDSVGESQQQ